MRGIGDVPLSERGIYEAHKVAVFLASQKINYICSSPALRTKQTAEEISRLLKKKVYLNDNLKERINFGDDGVMNYRHYVYLCEKSSFDRSYILPNGDTSISCGERFKKVISGLWMKKHLFSLIVSHGGIIADFLRNEFGDKQLNYLDVFFAKYKIVRSCSITTISLDVNTKKLHLLKLNNIGHLL